MKFIQSAILFVVIAQTCAGEWSICELSICVVQRRMSRYHGSCKPSASVNPISTPNYNANIRKLDQILTELGRINYISARNIISPNMVHFILSNKPHRNIVLVSNIRFYFILFVIELFILFPERMTAETLIGNSRNRTSNLRSSKLIRNTRIF